MTPPLRYIDTLGYPLDYPGSMRSSHQSVDAFLRAPQARPPGLPMPSPAPPGGTGPEGLRPQAHLPPGPVNEGSSVWTGERCEKTTGFCEQKVKKRRFNKEFGVGAHGSGISWKETIVLPYVTRVN